METRVEIREDVVYTVVDELRTSIDELDVRNLNRNPPPTIHQIPISVRKGNESAYTPTFVSIGPYHRDLHEQTKGMKILYLKNFLDRTGKDVKHYASLIESREKEARDRYHDRCNRLGSKEFVQMMVLDGCFIIELLLKVKEKNIYLSFRTKRHHWRHLRNDLMLMENQIPFFILKLIHDSSDLPVPPDVQRSDSRKPEILDLCLFFIHGGKITKEMLEQTNGEEDIKNVYHLLHLSYLCHMIEKSPTETLIEKTKCVYLIAYGFLFLIKLFLLSFFYALIFLLRMHNRQKVKAKEEKSVIIPTATELNEFGVKFKRKKDAKNSIDVSFENGIMEIPQVLIEDSSNSMFRNYLALEQNCPGVGNEFTSYAVFMDNLVDTASDVALLRERNIIVSRLGCDEDVAKLFNGLTVGSFFHNDNDHLKKLFVNVDSYSTRNRNTWRGYMNKLMGKMNKWMAMLTRDYFSSPWSIISLLGALTLLAFSATQVTYAVKNYHRM